MRKALNKLWTRGERSCTFHQSARTGELSIGEGRPLWGACSGILAHRDELADLVPVGLVALHLLLDFVARIHDRGVILLTEVARDLGQRVVRELGGNIHRDLARGGEALIAPAVVHLLDRQTV